MSTNNNVKYISIRGARLHNLKNVSADIPRNKFTVITGVSGSGKSSLAFDTLYAEGQRRFVESLSSYARQFLERMHKPDADSITGIPPAIAIQQNVYSRNPRSTVGTTTEIYDYIRVLYGRIGETICYQCGKKVRKDTPTSVLDELMTHEDGTKLYILFPITENLKEGEQELSILKEEGFFRIVNSQTFDVIDLNDATGFDLHELTKTQYFALADRLVLRRDADSITRITDSLELAFGKGKGRIAVGILDSKELIRYSSIYECAQDQIVYEEPDPKLFSFNNPQGACPKCQGFGRTIGIDEDLVFPDRSRSISKNAIHPYKGETMSKYQRALIKIAPKFGIDVDAPISELTDEQMKIIWEGYGAYPGLDDFFKMLEEKSYKMHYRVMLSRYRGYTKCKACGGSRLRTSARQVFVGSKNIPEIINLPLEHLHKFFKDITLSDYHEQVAGQLVNEICWRLELLVDIGLEYLTLSRLSHTLSGGESQRISLSTALGSSLVGTLYVLDEPSIGLHPRDTGRLIRILHKLRNLGNTVVVVEHDPDVIRLADHIIDMGPNAGEFGGEVIYSGDFDNLLKSETSLTGQYFSGRKAIQIPLDRHKGNGKYITVSKARENNLRIDKLEIPLGAMVLITGVSGSGKSTLVHDVIYAGLKRAKGGFQGLVGKFESISGYDEFEHIELVDQTPIGKSSRSTPATYTKVFDMVRDLYAQTQAAKQLGWKAGHFSFNVAGGRCDACEGEGVQTVEMQFLPDVTLECESCKGTRYKKEVRNIHYNGKSIVDILEMTIDEAVKFFEEKPRIAKKLEILQEVGLGYLRLGQPSTMLSGGEAQRIKLAGHLDSSSTAKTLFIFDEPTTGLHLDDISKLITCFRKLTNAGHSVLIIEHNIQVIAAADWIIDLGPEAGERGGYIVAEGTPEKIAGVKTSYTGIALKEFFDYVKNMEKRVDAVV